LAGVNGGLAFFAYCTNYLIGFKHAVIVDAEASYCSLQADQHRFGRDLADIG
jgi:hypothetical protein